MLYQVSSGVLKVGEGTLGSSSPMLNMEGMAWSGGGMRVLEVMYGVRMVKKDSMRCQWGPMAKGIRMVCHGSPTLPLPVPTS